MTPRLFVIAIALIAGAFCGPKAEALSSECYADISRAAGAVAEFQKAFHSAKQEIGKRGISRFIKYDFDFSKFERAKKDYAGQINLNPDDVPFDEMKSPEQKLAFLEALSQSRGNGSFNVIEGSENVQALVTLTRSLDFSKGVTQSQIVKLARGLYFVQFDRLTSLKSYFKYRRFLGELKDEVIVRRTEAILYGHDLLTAMTELGLVKSEPEKTELRRWFAKSAGWIGHIAYFMARLSVARDLNFYFRIPLFLNVYAPGLNFSDVKPFEIVAGQPGVGVDLSPMKFTPSARVGADIGTKEFNRVTSTLLVAVTSFAFVHGIYHQWKHGGDDVIRNSHVSVAVQKDDGVSGIEKLIAKHQAELKSEQMKPSPDARRIALINEAIQGLREDEAAMRSIPSD